MIGKYIVLSNIFSVNASLYFAYMYSGTSLDIKKFIVLHTSSAYNGLFVRYKVYSLIPGNVCVQAKSIVIPMKTLVLIDLAPCRKNPIKK